MLSRIISRIKYGWNLKVEIDISWVLWHECVLNVCSKSWCLVTDVKQKHKERSISAKRWKYCKSNQKLWWGKKNIYNSHIKKNLAWSLIFVIKSLMYYSCCLFHSMESFHIILVYSRTQLVLYNFVSYSTLFRLSFQGTEGRGMDIWTYFLLCQYCDELWYIYTHIPTHIYTYIRTDIDILSLKLI